MAAPKIDIFKAALGQAARKGVKLRTTQSINWFRNYVKTTIKTGPDVTARRMQDAVGKPSGRIEIGRMYAFAYDAKHKATLPYWDAHPLIFPFDEDATTIWGLNVHYLPPQLRAKAMDILYSLLMGAPGQQDRRLRLTYNTLKRMSTFEIFKPCVKRYLKSNFRTRPMEIPLDYWETALFLPTAQWQKAGAMSVYKDSARIMAGK